MGKIIDIINDRFDGGLRNLIFFLFGLAIGIVLFLLIFLIIYFIYKIRKNRNKIIKEKQVKINNEYENVIKINKEIYQNSYKDASIKEKLNGIKDLFFDMATQIAYLYYPNSKEPLFEISIDQLASFIDYMILRIDYIVDELLEEKLHFIDVLTKYQTKDIKISKVLELLEKKPEEDKENLTIKTKFKNKLFSFGKKIVSKVAKKAGSNIIDYEFDILINDIGNDLNKLYSNQELTFESISKREIRLINKENKRNRKRLEKELGDNYG